MLEIISYVLSGLITVITPVMFAKIITKKNIKISKLSALVLIFITTFLIILAQLYITGLTKTIIHCLLFTTLIKKLYKIEVKESTLLVLSYIFVLIIIDGLTIYFTIYIFKIDKLLFYNNYAGSLIVNSLVCITLLLVALLTAKYIKRILNHKISGNKILITLVILVTICILYSFYSAFANIEITKDFYINIGIILVFLIVLVTLVYQLIKNNEISLEYDKLLEFMKTYEMDLEKERVMRHENKNQLLTIKSKIYDKEKDSNVINYIDSILNEKIDVSQEHYAKFQYLPANGLKALFYFKTSEAENKGIKVSISVSKKVENSLLYDLNTNEFKQLGRLLGIYLDNAIESSKDSVDRIMGIEIYVISNNVEIIISNSYISNKEIVSNNGKSTKGKNRGHGLIFANNILNSTNKFEATKTVTDKLYIQKLIIKKSTH